MQKTNWRFVFTGILFLILSAGFFLFMLTVAPQSNDPAGMMRTVGTVSGVVGGISIALMILGLLGKKWQ